MPLCQRCLGHWPVSCICWMSVEDDHCGECNKDPCVCLLEEETPNELKRSHADISQFVDDEAEQIDSDQGDEEIVQHNGGYQRHFEKKLRCDERYSPEADLDAYFDEFGLSAESRIAMCRTYANYLTQKLRSSGRLGPARVKKPVQKKLQWK